MPQELTWKEIDLRGQICPSTLLTALREVNSARADLHAGVLSLCFLTDNRSSTTHISETVTNMGYQVLVEKSDGHYRISVSRSV
jgi:TusA-related sulfurtransferase